MHSYTLDTEIRRTVYVFMASIALALPAIFLKLTTLIGLPPSVGFPLTTGTLLTLMHLTFDKFIWRMHFGSFSVSKLLGIPDLNGKWDAQGISSYEDPTTGHRIEYSMLVTIKQSFSRIEIFAETGQSTSRSTLAGMSTNHAVAIFRYAFENVPKNTSDDELQRHPGLIELRINDSDNMAGDYFSGKHRLRFGELKLVRKLA